MRTAQQASFRAHFTTYGGGCFMLQGRNRTPPKRWFGDGFHRIESRAKPAAQRTGGSVLRDHVDAEAKIRPVPGFAASKHRVTGCRRRCCCAEHPAFFAGAKPVDHCPVSGVRLPGSAVIPGRRGTVFKTAGKTRGEVIFSIAARGLHNESTWRLIRLCGILTPGLTTSVNKLVGAAPETVSCQEGAHLPVKQP